ncbi:MAG: sulfatase-like hydrolase/transferase [Acidobacteriota bacterium]
MLARRSWMVWVANAGLVLGVLVFLAMLWTGGSSVELGRVFPDQIPFFPVLFWIGCFAALRLLFSQRTRGLEGRCVTFFARRGMPPRDAPATLQSASISGAFIGAGVGVVVSAGDTVRVVMSTSHPGPTPLQTFAVAAATLGTGAIIGAALGVLLSLAVRQISTGRRFDVGRGTFLCLMLCAPLVASIAPYAGPDERTSMTLMAVSSVVVLTAFAWFFLAPIAVARARNHQWGFAAAAASLIALLFLIVLLGSGGPLGSLQGPPEAEDASHPNVLLISVAGLRADFVGAYNAGAFVMPHVDGLAQRGTLFTSAITPSSLHGDAAQALLTGRYPSANSGAAGTSSVGLADLLSAHGYRTAAFVTCRCVNRDSMSLAGSFDAYDDLADLYTWLSRTALARVWIKFRIPDQSLRTAAEAAAAFRDWLSSASSGPWFAWVEVAAPTRSQPVHDEEIAIPAQTAEFLAAHPLAQVPAWADPAARDATTAEWWRGYAESVLEADDAVGTMLEALAQRGELHRTVVLVVSVHGMPLGESGHWFDPEVNSDDVVLRVPWIVAGPGIGVARHVDGPCSLVDVAPTLLGLLGLRGGGDDRWEGEDLSGYLRDSERTTRSPHSGPVFARVVSAVDHARWVMVARYGIYRLVRQSDGAERLTTVSGEEPGDDATQSEPPRDDGRVRRLMSELLTRHLSSAGSR